MAPLNKKKARKLHCKEPRIIDNFNSLFCKYAETHNLFKRVIQLDQKKFVSRRSTITDYEELDALGCKAVAFAEAKCRKLRKGNVAFSPELNMAKINIKAWTLVVNKVRGKRVSSRLLSRALKKAKLKADARALTKQEAQQKLKEAYKNYYLLKGQATDLCQTALETLAEAVAERESSTQAQTLNY
jgi:predicted GNAT family N-acyltransferase